MGCFFGCFFWRRAEEDCSLRSIGGREVESSSGVGVGGWEGFGLGGWRGWGAGEMAFGDGGWGDWDLDPQFKALGLD
jgi:hypothetical protein